jgi:hypothetical protein
VMSAEHGDILIFLESSTTGDRMLKTYFCH